MRVSLAMIEIMEVCTHSFIMSYRIQHKFITYIIFQFILTTAFSQYQGNHNDMRLMYYICVLLLYLLSVAHTVFTFMALYSDKISYSVV